MNTHQLRLPNPKHLGRPPLEATGSLQILYIYTPHGILACTSIVLRARKFPGRALLESRHAWSARRGVARRSNWMASLFCGGDSTSCKSAVATGNKRMQTNATRARRVSSWLRGALRRWNVRSLCVCARVDSKAHKGPLALDLT